MGLSTKHLAATAQRNLSMFLHSIEDFTDAELLTRPCDGANHPLWQIGHLMVSEARMIAGAGYASPVEVPAAFAEQFAKTAVGNEQLSAFPARAEVVEFAKKVRATTAAWIETLNDEDFEKPSPEGIRAFCPTLGDLTTLILEHTMMHLGQIQVARRKLGKKHIM